MCSDRLRSLVCRLAVIVTVLPAAGRLSRADDEAPPAVRSPLSPEEALKQFRLAPGLRIEIAACEPQVVDPVAVRFDEDGRMWVVEMRDYPHGPAAGEKPQSRIVVLDDEDQDGRFETSRVFADELLFATGLQPWRGGAFVTLAGRVAYLKDTDGDGRADQNETWYEGFTQENPQLRANHPRLGLDNYIYVANGLRNGEIVNRRLGETKPLSISGMDFRFDPLTGRCEAVSGAGQFGLTFDSFGNRFICSNRNPLMHVVLENRYLKLNPFLAVPAAVNDVAAAGEASQLFPLSRAWTTSNLHAHQFTAACGVEIYRGDALPNEYRNNGFTCDPTGNLLHREILEPSGATFVSHPATPGVEFLASPDEWFRPVNLETGPDGALYVVDMYRAVIEHPDFMPDELKQRPDLRLGSDRGRIYRVTAAAAKPHRNGLRMSAMASQELAQHLADRNAWYRETAARLLLERHDGGIGPLLETIAATPTGASQAAALHLLRSFGLLSDEVIAHALRDTNPRVVEQAVALAESQLGASETLRAALAELAAHPDARLRFQVALSMGTVEGDWTVEPLRKIALTGADDVWTRNAVEAAAGVRAGVLLKGLLSLPELAEPDVTEGRMALVRELAALVGARNNPPDVKATVAAICDYSVVPQADRIRRAAVLGLVRALARRGTSWRAALGNAQDDAALLTSLEKLFQQTAAVASDAGQDESDRLAAIELLAFADFAGAGPALSQLAASEPLQPVRLKAIESLAAHRDPSIGPLLLTDFTAQTPAIRRAVLDAVVGPADRAALLLDEIAEKRLAVTELDRVRADRLLSHADSAVAARARKLLADILPADRRQALADYQPVLKLSAHAEQGREVFRKHCSTCHRVGGIGVDVAPDISDTRTKTAEQLLTDILQPNRAIDNNYVSYAVATVDGQALTGIIAAETATSVTLKQAENKVVTLLRQDIEELRSTGISLMPDGLEKNIPPQDMADLLSFLKNWRYLDGQVPLGK